MNILYLSPHYDDAVYSCGGAIHAISQIATVTILTLMAGEPQPPFPDSPIIRDLHQRWEAGDNPVYLRRLEDQTAAGILGCRTQYADIPDCIYRTANGEALYPSEESLWGTVHPHDPAYPVLRQLHLPDDPDLIVYAPLAAGRHVDHQIVRDWALTLAQAYPQGQVRLYADYPYLRNPDAIAEALAAVPCRLQPHTVTIPEASIQAKIAAMQAYRSQITSFWEDESAVAPEVRGTFRDAQTGLFMERYYQVEI